ncbi:MAG: hypothetical protein DI601_00280 [Azospirillum brasilense]|nr:MAG: hypothetical protein DI601_00280 [Azospirillum brasilense]
MNSKTWLKAAARLPAVIVSNGVVVVAPQDIVAASIFDIPGERLLLSPATAALLSHGDPDPRQDGRYGVEDVRALRDVLLSLTDHRMVSDFAQSSTEKAGWRAYRQTLRDITETYPNPAAVQWPTPPDAEEIT